MFFSEGYKDVHEIGLDCRPPYKYSQDGSVFTGDMLTAFDDVAYRLCAVAFIGHDVVGQLMMDSFTCTAVQAPYL